MSQSDLGKQMTARGVKWSRVSVEKLENNRRGAVSVQELLALALVFDVPPAWLLAAPEAGEPAAVTANHSEDPWHVLLWLFGRRSLVDPPGLWWQRLAPAFAAINAFQSAVEQLSRNAVERDVLDTDPTATGLVSHQELDERDRRALRVIATNMGYFEKAGLALPPVPAEVAMRSVQLGVPLPGEG